MDAPQPMFEYLKVAADCTVGHVKLCSRLFEAAKAGCGFEGP